MTEPGFNLTPVDIRTQEFRRSLRGYDPEGVDEFRGRVADELERLLREKAVLEDRVQSLREQLKAFRDREKALNEALVVAQQLRQDTEQAARRDADLVIREARTQADALVQEARGAELAVRRDTEAAQRHFTAYLGAFRTLLERYLSEVDALDVHTRDGSTPKP
ncbi:MAG TPA: DivIVA domain-containing protein [Gemmatimonadales bacterium]|nr:DivIVA domain-containing protein [Gemmatimonadales bacterium]